MLEHPSIFTYSPQGSENREVRTISREDLWVSLGRRRRNMLSKKVPGYWIAISQVTTLLSGWTIAMAILAT